MGWVFVDFKEDVKMNHYFTTGELLPRPSWEEIKEMILRHTRMQIELKGEFTGIREMRKHVAWYTAGFPNSSRLRARVNELETLKSLEQLMEEWV